MPGLGLNPRPSLILQVHKFIASSGVLDYPEQVSSGTRDSPPPMWALSSSDQQ